MGAVQEVEQYLAIIRGAAYGRPYSEVTSVLSPSSHPKNYPPNPLASRLFQQFEDLITDRGIDNRRDDFLPWSGEQIDVHGLFRSLVTFADDHDEFLPGKFFPIDESHHFIEGVMTASRQIDVPLSLPQQLDIALGLSGGRLMAASVLCHSASRAVGRNRDQRIDPSFNFNPEAMQKWSASVARFDNNKQYDPPGDTYHFWATYSMGMTLRRNLDKHPTECMAYGALFYFGADIMATSRRVIARNPLIYKHKDVDRMGLKIGWKILS